MELQLIYNIALISGVHTVIQIYSSWDCHTNYTVNPKFPLHGKAKEQQAL